MFLYGRWVLYEEEREMGMYRYENDIAGLD